MSPPSPSRGPRAAPSRRLGWAAPLAVAALLWAASRPRSAPPDSLDATPPPLPGARVVDLGARGEQVVREAGRRGRGPTLVLVHGWMYPADVYWWRILETLAVDAHVLAVDLRGHGRAPRPPEPFRLADVADDVAALCTALETGPVILLGHSLGGPVAQLVWQRHPDVVAGLVLVSTAASFGETPARRALWRSMGALQLALRLVPRQTLERLLLAQAAGRLPLQVSRMITRETPREVLDRLGWMIAEFARGSPEDIAEAGRELGRYDARGWLATVDVPTAVVRSTRDRLVPPDSQAALAARIPTARRYDVDVDHDGHLAKPELVVPVLREAIADVHARRADG